MGEEAILVGRAAMLGALTAVIIIGFNVLSYQIWSWARNGTNRNWAAIAMWLPSLGVSGGLIFIILAVYWYRPDMHVSEAVSGIAVAVGLLVVAARKNLLRDVAKLRKA